jgi:hypothetical protein
VPFLQAPADASYIGMMSLPTNDVVVLRPVRAEATFVESVTSADASIPFNLV